MSNQIVRLAVFILTASLLTGSAVLSAADRHLTIRIEDGMPRWEQGGLPITIVLPIEDSATGHGAGLASFAEYGPYTIDGSKLDVSGDVITGTLGGKSRSGLVTPTWTIDAQARDCRVTGKATAPGDKRRPAVDSRVSGYIDAATGGDWTIECGLPWTDGGSSKRLTEDGSNLSECFLIRLRFNDNKASVVRIGSKDTNAQVVQSERIEGRPESFTADIKCLAQNGETPIRIRLEGGRIGRGGIVRASIEADNETFRGRVKTWKGAATVWAWPDTPGFVGGREQELDQWEHDADPDEALVTAAQTEAAAPIHPVSPGDGELWTHMVLQRSPPRCIASPVFDIRPLPVADKYHLTVNRIRGIPVKRVDQECIDPFSALADAWPQPENKKDQSQLGLHRIQLKVSGKPVWSMDAWWRAKASSEPPAWLAPVIQADSYRVRVTRLKETTPTVETTVKTPHDPVTRIWSKLTPGDYHLEVQGVSSNGESLGSKPWQASFAKVAAFQGPYFSKPARAYEDSALQLARWTADHPALHELRGHGNYNVPGGGDNGGCQILFGAVWSGLTRYHLSENSNERVAGLMLAREACEHLRGSCLARGGMPKVYKEGIANASLYGEAFLDIFAATGDERWREAAEMVARAFADSQLDNGTWAEGWNNPEIPNQRLKEKHFPGHTPVYEAGLIPGIHGPHLEEFDCSEVLWFLGRLRNELKTEAFRECEDKAYQWVMENSVKPFFWRDQGHHSPCMVPPFKHTGRCSSYFALYLLHAAPPERCDLKLVAELMRFSEERHLDWTRGEPNGSTVRPTLVNANIRESGAAIWLGSRFALVWAELAERTGKPLYAAKARAVMDAITHAQHPQTGNIDTGMRKSITFNRFATNAGRCAWNLRAYAQR